MKSRRRVKSLFSAHKTHGMPCGENCPELADAQGLVLRTCFVPVFGADRIPAHAPPRETPRPSSPPPRRHPCRSAPSNVVVSGRRRCRTPTPARETSRRRHLKRQPLVPRANLRELEPPAQLGAAALSHAGVSVASEKNTTHAADPHPFPKNASRPSVCARCDARRQLFQCPRFERTQGALAVVRRRDAPLLELQDGETGDALDAAQLLLLFAIHGADFDEALQLLREPLHRGFQTLAVLAPRRVELDQPDVLRVRPGELGLLQRLHRGFFAVQILLRPARRRRRVARRARPRRLPRRTSARICRTDPVAATAGPPPPNWNVNCCCPPPPPGKPPPNPPGPPEPATRLPKPPPGAPCSCCSTPSSPYWSYTRRLSCPRARRTPERSPRTFPRCLPCRGGAAARASGTPSSACDRRGR